jgi:hypothetical protein
MVEEREVLVGVAAAVAFAAFLLGPWREKEVDHKTF